MLQNTDRGAPEPPTGSFFNSAPSDHARDPFGSPPFHDGGAPSSATDAPFGAGVGDARSNPSGANDQGGGRAGPRRRRGSRGGRGRSRSTEGSSTASGAASTDTLAPAPRAPSEAAGQDEAGSTTRKRSRRGRRGSGSSTKAPAGQPPGEADTVAEQGPQDPADPGSKPATRKRSRRKRKAGPGSAVQLAAGSTGTEAAPTARPAAASPGSRTDPFTRRGGDEDVPDDRDDARPRRRRRGSRGGRGRRRTDDPLEVEVIPGEDDDLPDLPDLPSDAEILNDSEAAPRGRRGRGRTKSGSASVDGVAKKTSRGGRRSTKDTEPARAKSARRSEKIAEAESDAPALILVNASDEEEQRVAVVQDGQITDFSMTSGHSKTFVNDIYRGRVVNLEPAIGAAFVDFGQGRNGFLHTSDVLSAYGDKDWKLDKLLTTTMDPEEWDDESGPSSDGDEALDEDGASASTTKKKKDAGRRPPGRHRARPRLPVTDLLKKGQMVVVQVTKDAIGDKGPTLTTYISIPGRYLVLMPSMTRTGVSRKIDDDKERRRLKRILESLDVPPGMGVIVRTAGVGRTKADLKRDLSYLKSAWEAFGKQLRTGNGPAPLYRESDVAIRTIRDLFTPNTEAVYVDDPEVHKHLVDFTQKLMPENVERVQLHQGPRPLFHTHNVEQDFEKLFARRIELPSGGSIVFDQTEALVAIDVNSGRTRSNGTDFEEIALKTNTEAAPEIARQIRLRDLGGIIVCDFIDMMRQTNMRQVERVFKAALASDRARSKIGRISQFGLLELTRQRLGPGLTKKLFHTCGTCRGTGRIRNVESRAAAILRRLGSALTLKGFSMVEVRTHPEVATYLTQRCSEQIRALEYLHQREITICPVPDQSEDSVLRYLRTDGREVRPGGRRKR